jgi:hypothetical protein
MDSRQVGHAQRRRIGASPDMYDTAQFDGGGSQSESASSLAGTNARRNDPVASIAAAKDRLAQMKATPPGTNFGVEGPQSAGSDRLGARHRISVKNPGPSDDAVERTGVIASVPVSTNWEAVQSVFESKNVQSKIRRTDDSGGGMD